MQSERHRQGGPWNGYNSLNRRHLVSVLLREEMEIVGAWKVRGGECQAACRDAALHRPVRRHAAVNSGGPGLLVIWVEVGVDRWISAS